LVNHTVERLGTLFWKIVSGLVFDELHHDRLNLLARRQHRHPCLLLVKLIKKRVAVDAALHAALTKRGDASGHFLCLVFIRHALERDRGLLERDRGLFFIGCYEMFQQFAFRYGF